MDFYKIRYRTGKKGVDVFPDFQIGKMKDLMTRGNDFYAVWDEKKGLWSTDESDVCDMVDCDILAKAEEIQQSRPDAAINPCYLRNFSSTQWTNWCNYVKKLPNNYKQLDNRVTFANQTVKRSDYVSKKTAYPLLEGDYSSWDELLKTLYSPEEREKIEWAIGSIVAGEGKNIQKFLVFYGDAGTGKSTILNIIQMLFDGYCTVFEASELASASSAFSLEAFKENPLVAIQHDGDLSRISDNTKLNSIVSHEVMSMNEKFKTKYTFRSNAFLFMGTNKPVKITDAKSGLIRRLIIVEPTGKKIPSDRYNVLMNKIHFELGAIAWHCREVYNQRGPHGYDDYTPIDMMYRTDYFYNFVADNYFVFRDQEYITLRQVWEMYKTYCDEVGLSKEYRKNKAQVRDELRNYYENFSEKPKRFSDGAQVRSAFYGFKTDKFKFDFEEYTEGQLPESKCDESQSSISDERENHELKLDKMESILDDILKDCKAQYANDNGTPIQKWSEVTTKLSDLDTKKLHYVKLNDISHIVVDFDLKDENGNKSQELNLKAASKWPETYAEWSQGGAGIHLHYIYDGDADQLSRVYDAGIEIKVFKGNSSLRRRLSKCNNLPVAHIASGLPLKEKGGSMINSDGVKTEKKLRELISRNLRKEIHADTNSSVSFIQKILDDAYNSDLVYDVRDMQPKVLTFAMKSTHHAPECIKKVAQMKFQSKQPRENEGEAEGPIVFYDIECFPNLFLVCWKQDGPDHKVVDMINPTPQEIEELFSMKLVGFNCLRYDNHMLYGRYIGYDNEAMYNLSQRIIHNRGGMFNEAYGISYTDIYDFSNVKQSLKKFEIELGIHHQELGLPWDQPVPEDLIPKVIEYCHYDVEATEATFHARSADYKARQILSELSGLTMNDITSKHSAKILFGKDPNPQSKFIYTDLSEMFPGYKYEAGVSTYRDEVVGEGGYVYTEPGMYVNIALLDIESMHPTSIEQLNLFGPYTKNFSDIKRARLEIKHGNIDGLKDLLGGVLMKYTGSEKDMDELSYALKIVINQIYGLTSAKFQNKFRDPRNVDNIVAKRGALFMIDLKHEVQKRGFTVAHIKTDSIKIPNATMEIIDFVMNYGRKFGYNFEHEATYNRMCLVNKAVYIAQYETAEKCMEMYGYAPKKCQKKGGKWDATGAQFAQPYVYKTLFSHEPIEFGDMCETKSVAKGSMYLDFNENLGEDEHNYRFVGGVGLFTPINKGLNAGELLRFADEKYYAVTGTKGYRWMESEMVRGTNLETEIDVSYYRKMVDDAVGEISKYGDFEWFSGGVKLENFVVPESDYPPWYMPCGDPTKRLCEECPEFHKCKWTVNEKES